MKFKNAFVSFLVILIFFACSKEEEVAPAKIYSDNIVGEWLWVEGSSAWGGLSTPASCNCWRLIKFTSDSAFNFDSDPSNNNSRSNRSYRLIRSYDVTTRDSVDAILYDNWPAAFSAYQIKQDTLSLWSINMHDGGWSRYVRI